MTYPYLGYIEVDGKDVVVLFTNKDIGVVVHSDSDDIKYKFGKNSTFNEDSFDFLPEGVAVKIQN